MIAALVVLPLIGALLIALPWGERMRYVWVATLCTALAVTALVFDAEGGASLSIPLPGIIETLSPIADTLLLLFFLYQGIRYRHPAVWALSAVQLGLYGWLQGTAPAETSPMIVVDELSRFMLVIINVVGGIITFYAVTYLRHEAVDEGRKRLFLVYLFAFLSIMNAIVVVDSLVHLFFLFEMTTLASYVLIAFRGDATSRANALRALWMNQIGGTAILIASLVALYGPHTLSLGDLLAAGGVHWVTVAAVLIAAAALIKGAMIPFDGWLLGAMVAPTPVSAMLHSATMVKLAPFLVLKLSPALAQTPASAVISVAGAACFAAAAYLALSRSSLKEILGYSTIALLGLMVSIASIGTTQSMHIAMVLMGFHALSKALLFLAAGVLEKSDHSKEVDEMVGLVRRDPKSAFFLMLGFVSLTLPPFGLFVGKVMAIVSVASLLKTEPWMLATLAGMIVGSALLVLLYFKIASALLSAPSDIEPLCERPMEAGFLIPMLLLSLLIAAVATVFAFQTNVAYLFVPLAAALLALIGIRWSARFDRVKPYQCGETAPFDAAVFYFDTASPLHRFLYLGFGAMFVVLLLSGGLA